MTSRGGARAAPACSSLLDRSSETLRRPSLPFPTILCHFLRVIYMHSAHRCRYQTVDAAEVQLPAYHVQVWRDGFGPIGDGLPEGPTAGKSCPSLEEAQHGGMVGGYQDGCQDHGRFSLHVVTACRRRPDRAAGHAGHRCGRHEHLPGLDPAHPGTGRSPGPAFHHSRRCLPLHAAAIGAGAAGGQHRRRGSRGEQGAGPVWGRPA